jgi:glycosyltransferase involved in cell wall biosynthesis
MYWSIGGVFRAVMDLCAVLARRGHDVRLLCCRADDVPKAWIQDAPGAPGPPASPVAPRVTVLPALGLFQRLSRAALREAESAIRACDVLHLHAPWTPSNLQLARIARTLNRPYVLTVHGMLDDWSMAQRSIKKRIYLMLGGRQLLNRAAAVHCTAAAELDQARKWFHNDRAVVLPYLFDIGELMSPPGAQMATEHFQCFRTQEPKVLFLSRLHPKKGVELLLAAAKILRERGLAFRLAVAGDGDPEYEQTLRELSRRLGLDEIVTFLGLVKGTLKLSVYQASDLFVLPTSQENYGLVLPESLACGTPAITTRGVDIWRELQDAGVEIVDRTPDALANAIESLLCDEPRRRALSARGRSWVAERLDPDRLAEQYEQLYTSLSQSGRPSQSR